MYYSILYKQKEGCSNRLVKDHDRGAKKTGALVVQTDLVNIIENTLLFLFYIV